MKTRAVLRHVKVTNLNRSFGINSRFVEGVASGVLKDLRKDRTSEIDVVFTDDAEIGRAHV